MNVMTLALLLLATVVAAQAEPLRPTATPYAKQGDCQSGYYTSAGFCTPLNKDSRPAVPRPPGASCPSGWYGSGGACVKLNR